MKRFITILLALSLLASVGSIAYAEDNGSGSASFTSSGETASFEVTGNFQKADEPSPVYCVMIEYDDMTYTCSLSGSLVYHPDSHSYTNDRTFKFTEPEDKGKLVNPDIAMPQYNRLIRVTNKSNRDIYVKTVADSSKGADYNFRLTVTPSNLAVHNLATTTNVKNYEDFTVNIQRPSTPVVQMQEVKDYQLGTVTVTVSSENFETP